MNNAMTKIWGQDYVPLGKSEQSFLDKLHISPISFGSYISDNIFGYSGGGFFFQNRIEMSPETYQLIILNSVIYTSSNL